MKSYTGKNKQEEASLHLRSLMHDLDNLFVVIKGNLSLAEERNDDKEALLKRLEAAGKASAQAQVLARQMISLRLGSEASKESNVSKLLQDCVAICLNGTDIKHSITSPPELPLVAMGRSAVARIINNLLINAIEAMNRVGTLSIQVNQINSKEVPDEDLKPSEYVCISIKDSGKGIASANLEKIFRPGYTDKLLGKGLGLASSLSIVQEFGGTLSSTPNLAKGACFNLYMPVVNTVEAMKESIAEEKS
jgi:signal transduction histidine kinase